MKSLRLLVMAAGCLPLFATASGVGELCSGSVTLSEGQWARFAVDAPFMSERLERRYAVVGTAEDHFWLEYDLATPMGGDSMIVKILIPGWPYSEDSIKRAMMQLPFAPGTEAGAPMEVPSSSLQKDDLVEPIRMACAEADNGVADTLTVAAGTFNATRIPLRRLNKNIWLSSEVPFGIVKLADAQDKGMELMAFGSDAKSAITAEPQKIPGVPPQ